MEDYADLRDRVKILEKAVFTGNGTPGLNSQISSLSERYENLNLSVEDHDGKLERLRSLMIDKDKAELNLYKSLNIKITITVIAAVLSLIGGLILRIL